MVRKTAQEKLEALYPQGKPDPRYTPKTVEQAVNHIAGAKKPPKNSRATWEQRCALSEKVKPLYTKPVTSVPEVPVGFKWSAERDEHLFDFLMQGGIIRVWLDMAGLTYSDINRRKKKDPTFAAKYDEARSLGMDALADEALLIASTPMDTEEVAETTLADGGKVVVRKKATILTLESSPFTVEWSSSRSGRRTVTARKSLLMSQTKEPRQFSRLAGNYRGWTSAHGTTQIARV